MAEKIVYSPESLLRKPSQLFKSMLSELVAGRELAWQLLVRDLRSQYRQGIFGYLWAFLPPLLTTGLFVFLNRVKGMSGGETTVPYVLYVAVGMVFWQLFVDCLVQPARVVTASKSLIVKLRFPRESLLMAALGMAMVNFLVRCLILIPICIWADYMLPIKGLLGMFPAVLPLLLVGLFFGLLALPMSVLFSDIQQGVQMVTTFLLFVTPVGYAVPSGTMPWYILYNPLTYLVNFPRDVVLSGDFGFWVQACGIGAVAFVCCFVGWVIFRLSLPIILERVAGS